jgi:hypothetical protein
MFLNYKNFDKMQNLFFVIIKKMSSSNDIDSLLNEIVDEPDIWCAPAHAILSSSPSTQSVSRYTLNNIIQQTLLKEKEKKDEIKRAREQHQLEIENRRRERQQQLENQRRSQQNTFQSHNDRLKTIPIDELIKLANKAKENNNEACPICMCDNVEKVITRCGHIFCKTCVEQLNNSKCPLCRS